MYVVNDNMRCVCGPCRLATAVCMLLYTSCHNRRPAHPAHARARCTMPTPPLSSGQLTSLPAERTRLHLHRPPAASPSHGVTPRRCPCHTARRCRAATLRRFAWRCCPCHAAMPTVALASAAATAPSGAARRSGDAVLLTGDTPHELRSSRTPALTPPCRSPLHRVLTRLPRRVKHRAACRTAGLASARRRDAPRHTARHAARCCAKSRRKPPAVLCKGSRWHERPSWARCTDLRESDRALKPPAAVHLMLAGVHPTDETSGRAGLRRTAPQCWRKCERLTCVCRASARAA